MICSKPFRYLGRFRNNYAYSVEVHVHTELYVLLDIITVFLYEKGLETDVRSTVH